MRNTDYSLSLSEVKRTLTLGSYALTWRHLCKQMYLFTASKAPLCVDLVLDCDYRDGGGQLSRKELATGLFAIGIWLHPNETQALLEVCYVSLMFDAATTLHDKKTILFCHGESLNSWCTAGIGWRWQWRGGQGRIWKVLGNVLRSCVVDSSVKSFERKLFVHVADNTWIPCLALFASDMKKRHVCQDKFTKSSSCVTHLLILSVLAASAVGALFEHSMHM